VDALVACYREPLVRTEHALRETRLVRLEQLPDTVRATLQPAPGPSFEWRYLTLQDLIWLNSEITKSPQPYSYDRLEEATYYQYSYRQSRDVPLQAARFLWGYLKYRPFARGNLATALIATLAFLHINGYETRLPVEHAAEWMTQVATRRKHPLTPFAKSPRPRCRRRSLNRCASWRTILSNTTSPRCTHLVRSRRACTRKNTSFLPAHALIP
jgi:prophage maintenance system killer protein